MMFEHLGVVYNSNNEMINHRSLLKVIFNPFLRMFGLCIGTIVETENNVEVLKAPTIMRCKRCNLKFERYILDQGDRVIRRRLFF